MVPIENGSNFPLRGFKGGLYEGGHRVPAIAKWPGKIPGGMEIGQSLASMDLFPTLLDITQVSDSSQLDGISFLSLIAEGAPLPERSLFWSYNQQKAMRQGDWKLIQTAKATELYNLRTDISEQDDLSDSYPDRVEYMTRELNVWYEELIR